MKFFVPKFNDPVEADELYGSVKKNLETVLPAVLSARRVHAIHYNHNGAEYHAVVGDQDPIEHETVIAIFFEPLRNVYHVCTPNRAVIHGYPILVGGPDVFEHVDFD
jgi:hypothetical protein